MRRRRARAASPARRQIEARPAEHAAKVAGIKRVAGKQAEMRKTQATIDKLAASLPLVAEQRDIRQALDSEDQAQFQIWETAMRILSRLFDDLAQRGNPLCA